MKIEESFSPLRRTPSFLTQKSLVRASLDIGRVLADKDGVTFRAQGTCMYPTVRPGDILTIQSRAAANVAIGDIAVCRTPDYLFSHRVIKKGELEGKPYIATRSDRAREGSDAPTFDDNLLGVVVSIKRNGKPVSLVPTHYPWLIRQYYNQRLAYIQAKERLMLRLSIFLVKKDANIFYKFIIRTWFLLARPRLTYMVKVPLNASLGDAVFRRFEPDEFDPEMVWNNRKVGSWTIAVHLNDKNKAGAWLTFVRDEADNWCVAESHVRLRYRGAGLENMLMSQADKILTRDIP